jgi:uncharacterized membrane protein YfcA
MSPAVTRITDQGLRDLTASGGSFAYGVGAARTTYLWCALAVVLGTWLGLQMFHRIDDKRFRQVILLFLMISGATLLI